MQKHEPNWDNFRDYLRCQLNQVMLEMPSGGMVIADCPKCHTRIPVLVEKTHSIEQIIDVVMGHYMRFHHLLTLAYEAAVETRLEEKRIDGIELTPLQKVLRDLMTDGSLTPSDARNLW